MPACAGTVGVGDGVFTYLMASGPYGTLCCGHTDDLIRRPWQHKEKVREGFTAKFNVTRLVWYEVHDTREGARDHERRIKKWNRQWKIRLIEAMNPEWRDLYNDLVNGGGKPADEWLADLDKQASQNTAYPRAGGDPSELTAPEQPASSPAEPLLGSPPSRGRSDEG